MRSDRNLYIGVIRERERDDVLSEVIGLMKSLAGIRGIVFPECFLAKL